MGSKFNCVSCEISSSSTKSNCVNREKLRKIAMSRHSCFISKKRILIWKRIVKLRNCIFLAIAIRNFVIFRDSFYNLGSWTIKETIMVVSLGSAHNTCFKKVGRMWFLFWLMIMDSTILVIMDQKLKLHKWINCRRMVSDSKIIMSNRYAHRHEVNSCPENIKFTQARVKGHKVWVILYDS